MLPLCLLETLDEHIAICARIALVLGQQFGLLDGVGQGSALDTSDPRESAPLKGLLSYNINELKFVYSYHERAP
jgi:hypothetical protein